MTIEVESGSEAHTRAIAAALAVHLRAGDVVALTGPLGAGKTCFVRGLARGLGLDEAQVSSPTFVICQEYNDAARPLTLVHVDAYRVGDPAELTTIGWEELPDMDAVIVAVEWPDLIESAMPPDRIQVRLEHAGPAQRRISIDPVGAAATRLESLELEPDAPSANSVCPSCGSAVPPDVPSHPFCSQRCRMVDLGKWLSESYRISRPVRDDELE